MSLTGALQIGRSALTASQAALQVVGNNMANAATSSYSRQRVNLVPTQYTEIVPGVYTGTGVAVNSITRLVDNALNERIRSAVGDSESYLVQQQAMDRVEATMNELTDEDLSTQLNSFFDAWAKLQTNPSDSTSRSNVLLQGETFANYLQQIRGELSTIQEDLDTQVKYQAGEADALIQQIADINGQIVTANAGGSGSAAALRDQRDGLLKELSQLINITTREMDNGAVNVYVGNDPVIQFTDGKHISYEERQNEDGTWVSELILTDTNKSLTLTGGKLHGLITARDEQVGGAISDLDSWTSKLIYEVNLLHSTGQGLTGYESMTSEYAIEDATASLADMDATGLKWAANNGSFRVTVTDANGNTRYSDVSVTIGMGGTDTTLNDLVTALDNIDGISATINGANKVEITADSGYSFNFSASDPDDLSNYSNVLTVLGMNTYFEGYNADTIAVSSQLNVAHLGASDNGLSGNGDVAGKIAELATTGLSSLNGESLTDAYNSFVGQIGNNAKAAQDNYTASQTILETLEGERQSISGVSVDEEAINMITFQRAFQGAAKYITVIDQLMDEVLSLV